MTTTNDESHVIYVKASGGDDDGDGTVDSPLASIAEAMTRRSADTSVPLDVVFYVDIVHGDDAADGTAEKPLRTPTEAMARMGRTGWRRYGEVRYLAGVAPFEFECDGRRYATVIHASLGEVPGARTLAPMLVVSIRVAGPDLSRGIGAWHFWREGNGHEAGSHLALRAGGRTSVRARRWRVMRAARMELHRREGLALALAGWL